MGPGGVIRYHATCPTRRGQPIDQLGEARRGVSLLAVLRRNATRQNGKARCLSRVEAPGAGQGSLPTVTVRAHRGCPNRTGAVSFFSPAMVAYIRVEVQVSSGCVPRVTRVYCRKCWTLFAPRHRQAGSPHRGGQPGDSPRPGRTRPADPTMSKVGVACHCRRPLPSRPAIGGRHSGPPGSWRRPGLPSDPPEAPLAAASATRCRDGVEARLSCPHCVEW